MRTASRRARRLGGLLVLAATVWWTFLRRRANAVRWVEPPAAVPPGRTPAEPGAPGELPDDVVATDAGLTELPESATTGPPAETGETGGTLGTGDGGDTVDTVDETRVAELLAGSPDADVVVVDESTYEHAVADAAPEPPADPAARERPADEDPTERDLVAPAVAESPASGRPDAEAVDEETASGIAMPTFSEAPTMELPAVTDDLRAVRGIGPSMERTLHALGIVSYRQLALLDGAELERVRAELTDFRSRIEREDWVGQARALHRAKYGREP